MNNLICLDLEASCNDSPKLHPDLMEIIEIGACLVDKNGKVLDQFQTFVKPSSSALLTPFCTQLTTITQADVDGAPGFVQAVEAFEEWIAKCVTQFGPVDFWGSWGAFDRNQFERNARLVNVPPPDFLSQIEHRNLKNLYGNAVGMKDRGPGLGKALNYEGIKFSGTKHRGIDDALNISRLVPVCLGIKQSQWRDSPAAKRQKSEVRPNG